MRWREIWHRWKQITDVFLPPSTLCNHIIPFTASLLYRGIEEDSTWLCWKKAYFFPPAANCLPDACLWKKFAPSCGVSGLCFTKEGIHWPDKFRKLRRAGGGEGWWGKDYELNFISHDSSPALSLPLSHSHSLSLWNIHFDFWNSCHTCMKHIRGQAQSSSTSTNIYSYACPLLRREKEFCNRKDFEGMGMLRIARIF